VGKGEKEWVLQSRRKGVGECRREGGTAMLSVSAGVASSDRRSLKTVRSRARSLRSAYATSHYGGGAGEDPGREADLEWMARAMVSFYFFPLPPLFSILVCRRNLCPSSIFSLDNSSMSSLIGYWREPYILFLFSPPLSSTSSSPSTFLFP